MSQNHSRLVKIIAFILIIAITDKAIGLILSNLYFNQKEGPTQSLTYGLSECKADILIFGNSRAQHHYNPQIISTSTGMSCYNAGQDGGHSILLPYAQIKIITERHSPKIIILEFAPDGIINDPNNYDKLSVLLPYYNKYSVVRPFIKMRGPYEHLKLLSSIYPFNSNIINLIRFNTSYHSKSRKSIEGYIPLNGKIDIDLLKPEKEILTKSAIDTNLVNALGKIINLCKEKQIALYIINSPIFHKSDETKKPISKAEEIALEIIDRNHARFLDFSYDTDFIGHNEWFSDKGHLNSEGANLFTKRLIDELNMENKIVKDISTEN